MSGAARQWASAPETCPARERVHPYVTRVCQTCGYDPKRPETWVSPVAAELPPVRRRWWRRA